MSNKLDNGEILCGFGLRKDYEGQKDFDQTYKEVTIKKRVKKIGDGDEDFIIEEYEDIKETPIREVIDAQVDDVGIESYLRYYQMQGMEPPQVSVSDGVQDFTGFPEDPGDAIKVGDEMMAAFYSLDPALRGDAKSPEEFLNSITDDKLKAYYASKLNVVKKEEVKENDK